MTVELADACKAPVDKDRVSAAARLGEVLVDSISSVAEIDVSWDGGGGSSSLSEEILGLSTEAGFTLLGFSLVL